MVVHKVDVFEHFACFKFLKNISKYKYFQCIFRQCHYEEVVNEFALLRLFSSSINGLFVGRSS